MPKGCIGINYFKPLKTSVVTAERIENFAAEGIFEREDLAKAFKVHPATIHKHLQKISFRQALERGKAKFMREGIK